LDIKSELLFQASTTFGAPAATANTFGAAGGGAFGSAFNKPATTGFQATTTGYGAPVVSSAPGGMFGQPSAAAGGGLFGSTAGQPTAFGSAPSAAVMPFGMQQNVPVGTTIKFMPQTGTDTMMKSGISSNINTR
jgi:nuclear pore complex protein Nup98-Nup96